MRMKLPSLEQQQKSIFKVFTLMSGLKKSYFSVTWLTFIGLQSQKMRKG